MKNVFSRMRLILLTLITICVIASQSTADNVIYTYDDSGRLTMADYGDGNTVTYNYDESGNMLTMTSSAPASMPDVVGLSQADAESAIVAAGLTVGAVSTASSDTVPADNVISQNPLAGSTIVGIGSTVDIVVSTGPAAGIHGDFDGDGDVDRDDLNIILAARNTPASGPDDPRDLDGDGIITALDARKLVLKCTRPRCATE